MSKQDPRTYRDPAYPNISYALESPSGMPGTAIPLNALPLGDANVWIASDDVKPNDPGMDSEQERLAKRFDGDYMTGCPSIILQIAGMNHPLTWAEAYNLGRALIDKANEAHYG